MIVRNLEFCQNITACLAILIGALSTHANAQGETVLTTNYDLEFTVGDQHYSVQSSALVRAGSEVPIELGNYKVGLRLTDTPDKHFLLALVIYEKSDNNWYQISVPAPNFDGQIATPTEIEWRSDEILVDLALIVGIRGD